MTNIIQHLFFALKVTILIAAQYFTNVTKINTAKFYSDSILHNLLLSAF